MFIAHQQRAAVPFAQKWLECVGCGFKLSKGLIANPKCPDCGEHLHIFSDDKDWWKNSSTTDTVTVTTEQMNAVWKELNG